MKKSKRRYKRVIMVNKKLEPEKKEEDKKEDSPEKGKMEVVDETVKEVEQTAKKVPKGESEVAASDSEKTVEIPAKETSPLDSWEPKTSLEQGLKKTIECYKNAYRKD